MRKYAFYVYFLNKAKGAKWKESQAKAKEGKALKDLS